MCVNSIVPSVEGGTEKLCFLTCFSGFDPVLFEKSQLIVYGIICITLHVAECRFCVLLTSALVFVFFKPFWVLSEVSSGAVWDCRW